MKLQHWLCLFALTALAPLVVGCGNGASETPTVKIKTGGDNGGGETAGTTDEPTVAAKPGTIGNIRGRIVYKGAPPNLSPLIPEGTAPRDGEVCAADMSIPDDSLIVSQDGGLKNVFVYLAKKPKGVEIPPAPQESVPFDQKNCVFLTHALLVRVNQPVAVLNSDPIVHNTHTFPTRNDQFNSTIPASAEQGVPLVYTKEESQPLEVKCDLHTWMRAYHLPVDHPFAAVTAEDGSFEIQGLPSGKHEFRVWHEKAGFLDRKYEVTVQEGDNELATIEYDAAKFE